MALSGTSGRSTTGCHTCRLRKKKCDERHPVCANCTTRAIPCYGYGAKPAWMKGAGVEAELVKSLKRAAERNYRARRRGWRPEMGEFGDDFNGFAGVRSGAGSGEMQGVDDGRSMKLCEMGKDENLDGQYLSNVNVAEEEKYERRLSLSLRQRGSDSEPDTADETMFSGSTTQSYQTSYPIENDITAPFSSCSTSNALYLQRSPSPETLSSIWYQSNFASTYSVGSKAELGLLMHYLDNVFPLQFGFSCMKRNGYRPNRGRDWFLATLLVCKPMYFATLSISAHHLHLMKEGKMLTAWGIAEVKSAAEDTSGRIMVAGNQRAWDWDADSSFVMALRGLQGVLDDLQARGVKGMDLLRPRWQVLASMCQILSLEVFRNLGGNWPIHIEASRTFLSMIGSSAFSSTDPAPFKPRGIPQQPARLDILEQILRDDSQEILPRDHATALKHFVGSFVWVDILSRATGIPHPSTISAGARPFPYLPLLEDSILDLSLVMGCENWVFIILAKIIMLESALCAEHAQPLNSRIIILDSESDSASASGASDSSPLDLRSQATILKAQLECGLRSLLNARASRASSAAGSYINPAKDVQLQSSLVTEMFALAAHTYLNVVMLGAWPWLVPVRESVNRALTALETLPTEVLIRVSWPFAVTGCMVLEEGRARVRALVARGRATGINIGTVWKSMVVVEECWRLRDGKDTEVEMGIGPDIGGIGAEVSWVEAMESLGEKILLV